MGDNLSSKNLAQVVRDYNSIITQLQPLTRRTPRPIQDNNNIQIGDFIIDSYKLGKLLKILAEEHPEIMC